MVTAESRWKIQAHSLSSGRLADQLCVRPLSLELNVCLSQWAWAPGAPSVRNAVDTFHHWGSEVSTNTGREKLKKDGVITTRQIS